MRAAARPRPERGERLGHMSLPFLGAYCATKYALEALTDALRLELAPFGIQAVLIEPGTIRSEFEERTLSSLAPFRAGSPTRRSSTVRKGGAALLQDRRRPEQVARRSSAPPTRGRRALSHATHLAHRARSFSRHATRVADRMLRLFGGSTVASAGADSTAGEPAA